MIPKAIASVLNKPAPKEPPAYGSEEMDNAVAKHNALMVQSIGRPMNPTEEHMHRDFNSQTPEQRRNFTIGD